MGSTCAYSRSMVGPEPFVVAAVAGLGGPVDHDDQARADIGAPADPPAYLDVLGCRLWLADDGHQREAVDVDPDLDDVRRETDVGAAGTAVAQLQLLDGPWDLVTAAA